MTVKKLFRNRCKRGCEEGATAVEAALSFSIVMLVLFGVIEFGYALWQWNTMTLAVQQSGRYAMINYARCGIGGIVGCAISQMQTVLTNAAVCTTPAAGQMCVSATAPTGTPPTMTLTAIYNVNLVALLPPFTITSQTVVPID